MKRHIYIPVLCLILVLLSCSPQESKKIPPKAVKGVLDLRSVETFRETSLRTWDFEKDGTINLDGEWEFYFGEFCDPEPTLRIQACLIPKDQNYIPIPGNWNNFLVNEKPVGGDGYATYRLRVMLPKSNTPLAFKIPDEGTAYVMYVNGEKFASNGSVGKEKDTSVPEHIPIISPLRNPKEELEIVFYVSNFHYAIGGLWLPVKLGSEKAVRELRDRNLFLDMFLSGSILIMGFYHFVIYVLRRRDKSPLFFGAFCFFIVLRVLCTGEKFITSIFPETPFQLLIKMEYISFYLAGPCFAHFLYTIFPKEFNTKVIKSIWTIVILFSIPVVLTPTEFFTHTVNAFQIFTLACIVYFLAVIGLGIFRKREGGKTLAAGFSIIAFGIVNDILVSRGVLYTGQIVPQCLFGFIFFQSIMLSMRFSKSFNQAEKLSNELEQKSNRLEETSLELSALSQNLELKIQERTKDLEETKKEIEDLNTFSHLINSLSDLNSIFIEISKYFYHKFGITGSWLFLPDEKKEYLYAYKAYSYFKLPAHKYDYLMNQKIPLKAVEGGMLYLTFQRKKPFYLSKIPKFEFEIDKEFVETLNIKSFLYVPLTRKEECVGILAFSNMEKEMKLSKSDIHKITNLCSQIAGAIDTNYLLQQVDKSRRETEALNEISKSVNSNLNIKGILDLAMGFVNKNFGIDLCALYLVDKQKNKITINYLSNVVMDHLTLNDLEISTSEFSLEKIDHALGYVYQTKVTLYTKELVESINEIEKKFIDSIKLKSSLFIPLLLKNEVIGILGFSNYDRIMDLKEFEITTLEKIADQLTGAIYNSNLLEETEKARAQSDSARIEAEIERGISVIAKLEVEKAKKKTEDLNLLIKKVNETSDLEEIMKIILIYVKDNYHLSYYSLFKLDPKENVLKYANSIVPDYVTSEHKKAISSSVLSVTEKNMDSIHSRALALKTPIFIPDAETEVKTKIGKVIQGVLKHKSFITLPIILQNNPIGTLDFFSLESLALREEEITELSLLAEQLAGVIQGAILYTQVQEEKEKALTAREESEKQKQEIETLNEFTKLINSSNDINYILEQIFLYINDNFQWDTFWLKLVDSEKRELYSYTQLTWFGELRDTINVDFFKNFRHELNLELGSLYQTFLSQESYYVPDIRKPVSNSKNRYLNKINGKEYEGTKVDRKIVVYGKLLSIMQVPLIVKENVIGILSLGSMKPVELKEESIKSLYRFIAQIAGVIHNAQILRQTEEAKVIANIEKEKAIVAQSESEKQKRETEELNHLIKSLNEELDLKVIMQKVHNYIQINFGINDYGLYTVNSEKTQIELIGMTFPPFVSQEDKNTILNFKIPIQNIKGAHALPFKAKKPFYLQKIKTAGVTKEELFVLEKCKIQSFLMIPLILNNEPIGILDFSNYSEKMNLSKEDITRLSILGEQLAGIIHGSNLFKQVQEEKEKSEKAKQEIETLNEFTKLINSTSDISTIFKEIYSYLNRTFGFNNSWVLLVDKNKKELYSDINTTIYKEEDSLDSDFFKNFRVNLDEKLGTLYQTYTTAVPLYVADVSVGDIKTKTFINEFNGKTYSSSKTDLKIIIKGKLKSLLQIPLILQNEVIGILCLSIYDKLLELSHDQIEKLIRFSNQIAGVIHNAQLLKQTEEAKGLANIEKEKALVAREESEKAKAQVEFLNEFSKVINSYNNLDIIFSHAVENLSNKIDTDIFQLQLVDKAKNELFTRCLSGTDSGLMKKYNKLKVPLIPESGSLYLTYASKKTLYLKNIKRIAENKKSELDKMVEKDFQTDSVFLIPLLVNDEVIGIMSIGKFGGMKKLSKDEVRFVESLCEQLALAVNNSFLLEETENARKETEGLNDLMRNINSVSSLVDIMSFIMYYLETEYNFSDFYLLLNEESEKKLIPFSFTSARHTPEERDFFLKSTIKHSDLQGVFAEIFETKKPIFIKKENLSSEDVIAKNWIEKGEFDYLFLLPLVIYDELIGILLVHSPKSTLFPTNEVRLKIERFSDMIAGSIFNAKLLKKVEAAKEEADRERNKSEKLLLNILPKDVAAELKEKGFAEPVLFENVSVMFTDFKGFTTIAEKLSPQELIKDLDACFVQFDKISERFNLEKLKTIGDSYMCAGGIPRRNTTHAIDCCLAALEIQAFMNMMKKLKEEKGFPYWELRLGIHTGPLIAGVIGERKFAYDVWGDTVNTASRMESSGTPGKINISYSTYEVVKDYFECEYRGEVSAKNKGVVKMYYLERIKPEFSKDEVGLMPNGKFWEMYG